MLNKLCGMPMDCVHSWELMGKALEKHRIDLHWNEEDNDWTASDSGEDTFATASADDPKLAIARAIVEKEMSLRGAVHFMVKLTLSEAFKFGLSRDSPGFQHLMIVNDGVLDEMQVVEMELTGPILRKI